jgi:ferric-dicitrate binding protein FerR (iron transport regulator)
MGLGAGKMTFREPHEIHRRRFSRNLGVGLALGAFVALVFALTVVKVMRGDQMKAFDHVIDPQAEPVKVQP